MIDRSVSKKSKKETSNLRYAFGMFGTSIPINMFKTFAPIYYVDQLGVTTRQFSIVLSICALTDLFFVYIFGVLSDKKAKDEGRRKWMIYGAPFLCLTFIFFFNNQWIQNSQGLFLYLLILYVLVAGLDGMININYGALFPELFSKEKDRVSANAYRQVFQLCAMILSMAVTPLLVGRFGYGRVAIVYGFLAWGVIHFSASGYQEYPSHSIKQRKKMTWKDLGSMVRSPLLWFYGGATLCYSIAFSLLTQGMPFFTRYSLRVSSSTQSFLLFSLFGITILSIVFFQKEALNIQIENLWSKSFVILSGGFILMLIHTSLLFTFMGCLIIGVGIGAMMTSSDIIGAKVIDIDQQKNGHVRTGLFMSFFNSMFRLNGLVVGLAYFLTEVMYGFVNGEQVGSSPGQASHFLFIYFPLGMVVLGCLFSIGFKKKMHLLEAEKTN